MKLLDARLILIVVGFILATIAGDTLAVFDAFQEMVGQGGIIGPICTAMGYAYVLRATECDKHMVRLLTNPLRSVGWLLIPGGAFAGFITNIAITSQTASAAAIGPILYPIMRAAGHSPVTCAATILIGCSVGGNLFNPGEPDIVAIVTSTNISTASIINAALLPNLLALGVAVAVLMVLSLPMKEHHTVHVDSGNVSLVKALMAPLPVALLLLLQPALGLFPYLISRYPNGVHVSMVMVACTGLAMLVTTNSWRDLPNHASKLTVSFFEGMGYAFAKVISIIIAASCFIAGLKAIGFISWLTSLLIANTALGATLAPLLTWVMAVIGGSGTAPSVAFSKGMLPSVAAVNAPHAVEMGVLAAIGANVGRTMSPVAAVVLFSSALSEVPVPTLLRRVIPCMAAAIATTVLIGLFL